MSTIAEQVVAPEQALRRPRIIAVVPCRMKSSRLRHKATLPIYGVPSIQRCLLNTMAIKGLAATVLVTSTHPDDAVLEGYTREIGAEFLRGSEDDVLERYLAVDQLHRADFYLRITGDCPVISFEICNFLIERHLETKADVTFCSGSLAVGTSCEVYSAAALHRLRELFPKTEYSEYMIMYFKNNPSYFRLNPVDIPANYRFPEWRLTLDEQADLDLFNLMFSTLDIGRQPITFQQIHEFFIQHPTAIHLNSHIKLRYVSDPEWVALLRRVTTITSPSPAA